MKAIYYYMFVVLLAATGCADENFGYGDKGVPKVEYAIDPVEMVRLGVMSVPALMVDGHVVSAGRSLNKKQIMRLLEQK